MVDIMTFEDFDKELRDIRVVYGGSSIVGGVILSESSRGARRVSFYSARETFVGALIPEEVRHIVGVISETDSYFINKAGDIYSVVRADIAAPGLPCEAFVALKFRADQLPSDAVGFLDDFVVSEVNGNRRNFYSPTNIIDTRLAAAQERASSARNGMDIAAILTKF